jgi:NTP pyrophosphatase (non-canonical NTP hydrolase)
LLRQRDLPRSTNAQWTEEFYRIYGQQNAERSAAELWLGAVRHASRVAEEVRKTDFGRTLEEVAYQFCWLWGFVAWCERSSPAGSPFRSIRGLDEILWWKYPGCCPVCTEARCSCISRKQYIDSLPADKRQAIRKANEHVLATKRKSKPPTTLIEWKEMFGYIYSEANASAGISEICFHLLEEIGEVAQEIFVIDSLEDVKAARDRVRDLEGEIADVFSWMFALVVKVQNHFQVVHSFEAKYKKGAPTASLEVTEIIWKAYHREGQKGLSCQHCHKHVCQCGDKEIERM